MASHTWHDADDAGKLLRPGRQMPRIVAGIGRWSVTLIPGYSWRSASRRRRRAVSAHDLRQFLLDEALPLAERVAAAGELADRPDVEREGLIEHAAKLVADAPAVALHLYLALGRRGEGRAREPLRASLGVGSPWWDAEVALVLKNGLDDDTGLVRFAADLGVDDEVTFVRAWNLYRAIDPSRRDGAYVERVGAALGRAAAPARRAALLHLLFRAESRRRLGTHVVPLLADRSVARLPVLRRRVRVDRLAADCLLAALGRGPTGRGPLASLRRRRERRWLRQRVRGQDDWTELCGGGDGSEGEAG